MNAFPFIARFCMEKWKSVEVIVAVMNDTLYILKTPDQVAYLIYSRQQLFKSRIPLSSGYVTIFTCEKGSCFSLQDDYYQYSSSSVAN